MDSRYTRSAVRQSASCQPGLRPWLAVALIALAGAALPPAHAWVGESSAGLSPGLGLASGTGQAAVEGLPLVLPGGQLAILGPHGSGVAFLMVGPAADGSAAIDLQPGDVVARLQGHAAPTLAEARQLLDGVPEGARVELQVERDGALHTVTFSRQANRFAVPRGAGSWSGDGGAMTVMDDRSPTDRSPEARAAALLEEQIAADEPGAVLAVARNGQVILTAARGLADLVSQTSLSDHSVLPADSVTKVLTGFAIAQLAAAGKLSLDEPAGRYLAEVPEAAAAVTVANLLHHTSGIKDYTGLLGLGGWRFEEGVSREMLLHLISRQRQLDFPAGESHRYSNTNYALLAEIVARVADREFAEWVRTEILGPAGLSESSLAGPEPAPAEATTYAQTEDGFTPGRTALDLLGPGGLMTTASDLARWGSLLADASFGGTEVNRLMRTRGRLDDGTEIPYGLGIGTSQWRGYTRMGHSGSSPWSSSVLHLYPEEGLAVAVLANRNDVNTYDIAEAVAGFYLEDADLAAASDDDDNGLPAGAMFITDADFAGADVAPLPADAGAAVHAGRYELEDGRELIVEYVDHRLRLSLRDDLPGVPLVLRPSGRYLFRPGNWEISFPGANAITLHLNDNSVSRSGTVGDVPGVRVTVEHPGAAELATLVGTYVSEELELSYRITLAGDALVLEAERIGRLPMTHFRHDSFGLPGRAVARVEFLRDAVGAVTGLRAEAYAWGVTTEFRRTE